MNKFISNINYVIQENRKNLYMIIRLAVYEFKLTYIDSYLGALWAILSPLIQIGTYWFVFGIGLRSGRPIDGVEFLPWLVCGIVPWFLFGQGLASGTTSIYSRISMVSRMKFPLSISPLVVIVVKLLDHIFGIIIIFVILIAYGCGININNLGIIYYILYTVFLTYGLSLITSALMMIARDFNKLIQAIIRLLFYFTPIFWSLNTMSDKYVTLFKINPVSYIVNGYRESLLYNIPFYKDINSMIIFWLIALVIFIVGCNVHMKYRERFVDLL